MAFTDLFSEKSADYASSRPTYPDDLFRFIAAVSPGRERAWDCATGSGQAAQGLARHFGQVEATDASAQQIANAIAAPRVRYSVQPAEHTDFADASFDAVCVAQALHWFDLERFYAEVRRVLRPRGVIVVVGYDWSKVTREVDFALQRHVLTKLEPYWPAQTRVLQTGYKDLPFPFERIDAPRLSIQVSWTVEQYLGYVGTWTATRGYLAEHGDAALDPAAEAVRGAWGAEGARKVTMALHALCGRHVPG